MLGLGSYEEDFRTLLYGLLGKDKQGKTETEPGKPKEGNIYYDIWEGFYLEDYRLKPGDRVNIINKNAPDVTIECTVSEKSVFLGMDGTIKVTTLNMNIYGIRGTINEYSVVIDGTSSSNKEETILYGFLVESEERHDYK